MKTYKTLIGEVQQPLSKGETDFKAMHGNMDAAIAAAKKLVPGITDQDVIFNGIEKTNSIKTGINTNISDYDKGLKVNEANAIKQKRREDNLNATKKTFPNVTHTTKDGHPDWEKHGIKDMPTAATKRVAEGTDAKERKHYNSQDYMNKNKKIADKRTTEVDTMVNHDCAKHIAHEQWGFGTCIPGEHTIVETSQGEGYVTHYDIMFEHGIEYDVSVEDIKVIISESHGHTATRKDKGMQKEEAEMDYEGEMARSELNAICDKSRKLADMMSDDMQLEAWLQSKITKAKYMIDSVYDYLMYSDKQSGMKSPMPSSDAASYAQAPAMAANYSSFLNKMAEEKILSAKQKMIARLAGDPEEIGADDFEKLRSSKKGSDTEETTAHRKKIISRTVEEAKEDDEEKADKQSGASLNPITRLNAAHQLLRGKIGVKHPIKFDDGKHELDINTVRKALDLHGNAKTATEKEKIQNAYKTHAGLQDALKGKFAEPRSKVSLGGSKRIGGIGEYGSIIQEDSNLDEKVDPTFRPAAVGPERVATYRDKDGVLRMRIPKKGMPSNKDVIAPMPMSEETMLNNLYHSLSEDNKATFMEKLRTEDGLTELLQFAQEQGL